MQASDAFSLGELHGAAAAHRRTAASAMAIRDRLSASNGSADIVVDRRALDALLGSILDTLTEGAPGRRGSPRTRRR